MRPKFPTLKTNAEAEAFVANADLAQFDFSDMAPMRFEVRRKDKTVSLRLPEPLLEAVRRSAAHAGIPTQRIIRLAIARASQQGFN